MQAKQLVQSLSVNPIAVCEYLLPDGRLNGHEYLVGNIHGEVGKSLSINVGSKPGIWSDFATSEQKGDWIDLWMLARNIDFRTACKEIKDYLGIISPRIPTRRTYKPPQKPKDLTRPKTRVAKYMAARGISEATMERYRIGYSEQKGICFPYIHDSEVKHIKYCTITEHKADRRWSSTAETMPCLFGWQAIPEGARQVIIVEGEFDALALGQYGLNGLSVPKGGGEGNKQDWVDNELANFEYIDDIVLALDNDLPGQEAVREIIKRLGNERCRVLIWPDGIKDANDALLAGYTKIQMQQLIDGAKHQLPEKLKDGSDIISGVLDIFHPSGGIEPGIRTPWVDKVGTDLLFRDGELTLWSGYSGSGKTQMLNHVVVGAIAQGYFCGIASMEMLPQRLYAALIQQATGTEKPSRKYAIECMQNFFLPNCRFHDDTGQADIDELIQEFRFMYKCHGAKMFVVDSLMKCQVREDDWDGQKEVVGKLIAFAQETNTHVHLVAHQRKPSQGSRADKYGIRGSIAITDLAHNVVIVHRNKKKEIAIQDFINEHPAEKIPDDIGNKPDAILVVDKQRTTGWEGKFAFWFNAQSKQYLPARYYGSKVYYEMGMPVAAKPVTEDKVIAVDFKKLRS